MCCIFVCPNRLPVLAGIKLFSDMRTDVKDRRLGTAGVVQSMKVHNRWPGKREEKISCCTGDSSLRQQCAGPDAQLPTELHPRPDLFSWTRRMTDKSRRMWHHVQTGIDLQCHLQVCLWCKLICKTWLQAMRFIELLHRLHKVGWQPVWSFQAVFTI